jgi:hypothetical protein
MTLSVRALGSLMTLSVRALGSLMTLLVRALGSLMTLLVRALGILPGLPTTSPGRVHRSTRTLHSLAVLQSVAALQ